MQLNYEKQKVNTKCNATPDATSLLSSACDLHPGSPAAWPLSHINVKKLLFYNNVQGP